MLHEYVQYPALMGLDAAALASVIGSRVRNERTERGWTLDRLAETAGVSRQMVVNVEQGAVKSLVKEAVPVAIPPEDLRPRRSFAHERVE